MLLSRFLASLLFLSLVFGVLFWLAGVLTGTDSGREHPANSVRRLWRLWVVRPVLNPLLKSLRLMPVCVLPKGPDYARLSAWLAQGRELIRQTRDALKYNAQVPAAKRDELAQQLTNMPDNLVELAWKLARLRRLQAALDSSSADSQEVQDMADGVLAEMQSTLHVLQNIPVTLFKLELAADDRVIEALIRDLREANLRMRDVIEAHRQVQHRFPDA